MGPSYTSQSFDAIYSDLAKAYGADLHADFFAPLREFGLENMGQVMQADGLHPNAAGVALIVAGIGPLTWKNSSPRLLHPISGRPVRIGVATGLIFGQADIV